MPRPPRGLAPVLCAVVLCAAATRAAGAGAEQAVRAADSLAAAHRYEDAAARYAAALAAWPESLGVARRALGTFWRAGRYRDAYVWGRRVLAREPHSLDALFDVGVTCGFLVEPTCVDSVFHAALALDSTFVDGYGELAFLAQARGDLPGAIRTMEAALAAAPDDDFARSGLAQMLIPAGQAARARALLAPRLAANPRARAYGGRSMRTLAGWAQLALGDTAGARQAFGEVLERLAARERGGETSYQLFRERAAILALEGDRDGAVAAMRQAYAHGWHLYGAWTLVDPMFAPVADDPRVAALLARMRADVRAERRRLGWSPAGE